MTRECHAPLEEHQPHPLSGPLPLPHPPHLFKRGHRYARGQYVRSVDYEGAAHRAGLQAGDRILSVNGKVGEQ